MQQINYRDEINKFFDLSKTQDLSNVFLDGAFSEKGIRVIDPKNSDGWVEYRFLLKTVDKVDHLFLLITNYHPTISQLQVWDFFSDSEGKKYSLYNKRTGIEEVHQKLNAPIENQFPTNLKTAKKNGLTFKTPTENTDPEIKQFFERTLEILTPPAENTLETKKSSKNTKYLVASSLALTILLYLAVARKKSFFPFRPMQPLNPVKQ